MSRTSPFQEDPSHGLIPRRVYTTPMFTHKPPATLEPPTLPVETTTAERLPATQSASQPQADTCSGCGRKGHTGKTCFYKKHCNFNGNGGPWSKSRFGPTFASNGHNVLPRDFCIDHLGNMVAYSMPPAHPGSSNPTNNKGRGGGGRGRGFSVEIS